MRRSVWLICVIGLAICLLLILLRPSTEREPVVAPELAQPSTDETNQPIKPQKNSQVSSVTSPAVISEPQPPPAAAIQSSNTFYDRTFAEWQVPIEFYGRVVDESNGPVSGASVRFSWTDLTAEDHVRTSETECDTAGLFSLHGAQGASLTVWVGKDGYYAAGGGQKGFSYALTGAKFSPDPRNPVVFNLRRKGQGVELITSKNGIRPNLAIRLPKDNTPAGVDFFKREVSPSGQLEVSQNKPPWRDATEWSFRLSIPDGGLVENADEFQFEAPAANYQPTVEYQFKRGETNWTSHVTKQFYVAFGQPRIYGWLRIESDLAQETVFLTYALNPSGSRNLEPMP